MAEMLTAVAIMFIVAGPFLLVANRYGIPAAPLLIIAGIIGGAFIDEELVLELAQFGIALLVFAFGASIQLSAIHSVLADSELAATAQIFIVGTIGFGFALLMGTSTEEALVLGIAVALSSTIIGTALLQTEIHRNLVHGRLGESIQFVQDLVAIGILLLLGAGVFALDPIVLQLGYGLLFLLGAVLVNRYVFDPMARLAGDSTELLIIGVMSLLVVFIGAAAAVGLPIVIGAFAAGLAVRYDPSRYLGLFNGLESIKDFFVTIFFVTVGALIVVPFVHLGVAASIEKLTLVAGLVFLTVIVKPAVTIAVLIYRGYEARTATLTALSTDQVSEFSLIIAIEAFLIGLLTGNVLDAIILAAAITMITSQLTQQYGERIYRLLVTHHLIPKHHDKVDELSAVPADIAGHVVIVGYGRKGRRMVDACNAIDQPYVVIEHDPALYPTIMNDCAAYVFGDAVEPYTWEKANVDEARLIVSATSSTVVSYRLVELDFGTDLILRASDRQSALALLDAGATYVVVPDLLASEQLITYVTELLMGTLRREELREAAWAELQAG